MRTYRFRNPQNGYVVSTEAPWAWAMFFGGFYFMKHGAWGQAVIALAASVLTAGLAWLVYPFFAARIVRDAYLRRGWLEVK